MGKVQTYRRGIGAFISSEKGQRFFNFAYSIGAAVVIWGALFKILHLPGGNALLSIGMGTEVLMFVLTAFDRPPREYQWEQVFPALNGEGRPIEGGMAGGSQVFVGGDYESHGEPVQGTVVAGGYPSVVPGEAPMATGEAKEAGQNLTEHLTTLAEDMQALHDTTVALNQVSDTLSRNITSLNTLYDLQLRSITSQLHNLDNAAQGIASISDSYARTAAQSLACSQETEKMANNIAQLNAIYSRMLSAMLPPQPVAPQQPEPVPQDGATVQNQN